MIRLRLVLILAVGTLLHGCTCAGNTPPPQCKFDSDCEGSKVCNPTTFQCDPAPICPSTPCATGRECIDGKCYAKDCSATKTCASDQVCVAGNCTETSCLPVKCASGQTCVAGTCYRASCAAESCLPAEVCKDNACVPRTCSAVSCPAGSACIAGGSCAPTTCAGGAACSEGQVCQNGACVETRCTGVTCAAGERCAGGSCFSTECGATTCGPGTVCAGGGCVDVLCANVSCPSAYRCSAGLCIPSSADGGYPLLPDGGLGVVLGPDGGIIGIPGPGGPGGGPARLPDGGIIGGPCRPSACAELACDDGVDNDGNGLPDCLDPACERRSCSDNDACTFGEYCSAGTCAALVKITCNSPPANTCYSRTGTCQSSATCSYPVLIGNQCTGGVCKVDGACGPDTTGQVPFPTPPQNFNPMTINPPSPKVTVPGPGDGGTPTFNSGGPNGGTFTGNWGPTLPTVTVVQLDGGSEASVIASQGFTLPAGQTIRLTGPRPVIFASFGETKLFGTIDASGYGTEPGAGGNHARCGNGTGGPGNTAFLAASGAGGAGARTAGGAGGTSNFGGSGGAPGVARGGPSATGPLEGGCAGGRGGGTSGGVGGAGGGAVQISSAGPLATNGARILVNGAGGFGAGGSLSGGGGGGSGGKILLEGYFIGIIGGALVANGGGGGEGNSWQGGVAANGSNGLIDTFNAPGGNSGNASFNGGVGGRGGARNDGLPPGNGISGTIFIETLADGGRNNFNAAGGGGGGAAGFIHFVPTFIAPGEQNGSCAIDNTAKISPKISLPFPSNTPCGNALFDGG